MEYANQHYEDVAKFIASFIRIRMVVPGGATGPEMTAAFADLFTADNPLFDREQFITACES